MRYLIFIFLLVGCYNATTTVNPVMVQEMSEGLEVMDAYLLDGQGRPRIEYLIIHCTGSVEGSYYEPKAAQRDWNRRGFNGVPGYHWMIQPNGRTDTLRPIGTDAYLSLSEIVYSAKGYNNRSLAVSYVGGTIYQDGLFIPKDTRTAAQKTRIAEIVRDIKKRYPWIKVIGHKSLTAKACPSFDVTKEKFE